MYTLAPDKLSDLIGRIYDCAIDPDLWPDTLAEICRTVECRSGIVLLLDFVQARHKFAYTWGITSDWANRYFGHSDVVTQFYAAIFSRKNSADGEPLVLSRYIERVGRVGQQVYAELTRPEGISDIMQTVVLRESKRLAVISTHRHDSAKALSEVDLAVMRLLAPHIQRAVKIVDILDVKKIEAQTLAATLDNFTAGVVVVGDRGRILHANAAARDMLSARAPIAEVNGALSVRDPAANRELADAIAVARADEGAIGSRGIGVALPSEQPSVAHVLPLARGELRTRLMPQATAAVFITPADVPAPADLQSLARSFGLTPAETRMIERLAGGETVDEAAATLGISRTTAKTHLLRIFSKTGVSRQAELIALINRVLPPVRRP